MSTLREVEILVDRINAIVDAKKERIAKMRDFAREMKESQRTHGDFDDEDIAAAEGKIAAMVKEVKQYEDLGKKWMREVGDLHEKINRRSKLIGDHYNMLQEKDLTDLREKFVQKQRELIKLLREHTEQLKKTLSTVDIDIDAAPTVAQGGGGGRHEGYANDDDDDGFDADFDGDDFDGDGFNFNDDEDDGGGGEFYSD